MHCEECKSILGDYEVGICNACKEEAKAEEVLFTVSGGFFAPPKEWEPIFDFTGEVCGYRLPDGRKVSLAVCLEVEDLETEEEYFYVSSEKEMEKLGFRGLDYSETTFYPQKP